MSLYHHLAPRARQPHPPGEIAGFRATPGETYTIRIRRWSGTDDVWYGVAWNTVSTPLVVVGDLVGLSASRRRREG